MITEIVLIYLLPMYLIKKLFGLIFSKKNKKVNSKIL